MDRLKADGEGDCFEVAAQVIVGGTDSMVLCHGSALGTGGEALGLRYAHAWVETLVGGDWFVIDKSNGHDHFGQRARYYAAGTIEDVRRYSKRRAMGLLLSTRHYGPWLGEEGDV